MVWFEAMSKIIINDHIVADPSICHGKPTFKGTRVMVWQILEMLSAGETARSIRKGFPSVTFKHIRAALEYASTLTREHYVIVNTQPSIFA